MSLVVSTTLLQLGHRNNRLLIILVVSVLMILSITLQSLKFYLAINSNDDALTSVQNKTKVLEKFDQVKQEDFQLLFGFNNRTEPEKITNEIPLTKMNLVLRGVLSSLESNGHESAIIQAAKQDKLYELGDTLPGGGVLNQVYPDHVIIKRGNQLEKLYFPDTSSNKPSNSLAVSNRFQEFNPAENNLLKSTGLRPGNHRYPDGSSLEQRIQEVRHKVQEASQEL